MTLTGRDRLFICGIGLAVIVVCALITLTRSADAKQGRANVSYSVVTAHGPSAVANCPSGSHVVGGGGHQAYGYTFRAIDMESYPVGNGWKFGIKSDTHRWIDVKTYAVCSHG
jgi:hypothetical protein